MSARMVRIAVAKLSLYSRNLTDMLPVGSNPHNKLTQLNVCFHYREKPHDTEWNAINQLKLPLLLNFAQCKLRKMEYYEVIEHCTEVLKFEPSEYDAINRNACHVAI